VKGRERAKAKSKYDEDVLVGNHKSVWGSWYNVTTGEWGFACCHSTIKKSYCGSFFSFFYGILKKIVMRYIDLFTAGQAAIDSAKTESTGNLAQLTSSSAPTKSLSQLHTDSQDQSKKRKALDTSDGAGRKRIELGEGDVDERLDKGKLKDVLEGKSGGEFGGKPVSEEEMGTFPLLCLIFEFAFSLIRVKVEAYRMQREQKFDDPAAQFGDELLPL
jgi:pre-mRNA-processing factor SLU7